MSSNLYRNQRRKREGESFDRKFDQFIETGRQFVDGVSGTRPGKRKPINTNSFSTSSLEKVGQWVGDKLDWILEDEDDWIEPWQLDQSEQRTNFSNRKRPLEAISLRGIKSLEPALSDRSAPEQEDQWPDESSFRVDRWERKETKDSSEAKNFENDQICF